MHIPPPDSPIIAKQEGLGAGSIPPLKGPFESGSLKPLITSEVVDRLPRANQRRMGIGHGAPSHTLQVRHLPRTMHAAYLAKKAGMVGNVERQFEDWKGRKG